MKVRKSPSYRSGLAVLLLLLMVSLLGCTHVQTLVAPLANPQVVGLDADGIVRVMQRAGFSDEQILNLGTDLRNCLALKGAAQIRVANKTEAIFAVYGPCLHVSSRQTGSFIYNAARGEIR